MPGTPSWPFTLSVLERPAWQGLQMAQGASGTLPSQPGREAEAGAGAWPVQHPTCTPSPGAGYALALDLSPQDCFFTKTLPARPGGAVEGQRSGYVSCSGVQPPYPWCTHMPGLSLLGPRVREQSSTVCVGTLGRQDTGAVCRRAAQCCDNTPASWSHALLSPLQEDLL